MISELLEYQKHRGTPDQVTFRRATAEEEERFRKAESVKALSIPAAAVAVVFCVVLCVYMYNNFADTTYVKYVPIVFLLVAVIGLIWRVFDFKKSESYEVAEGICVMIKKTNHRTHAAVWVEKDEVYLPKLRYLSVFHLYTNTPLLIVKGDRGEGKKPHYFVLPDTTVGQ